MTVFTVRSCQPLVQPSSCLLSTTTYSIYSQLPSTLEAIPPFATQGHAMTQWKGPTHHGSGHIKKENNLSPASKQLNHSSLVNSLASILCYAKSQIHVETTFHTSEHFELGMTLFIQSHFGVTEFLQASMFYFENIKDTYFSLTLNFRI
jgi:hypothetical protein